MDAIKFWWVHYYCRCSGILYRNRLFHSCSRLFFHNFYTTLQLCLEWDIQHIHTQRERERNSSTFSCQYMANLAIFFMSLLSSVSLFTAFVSLSLPPDLDVCNFHSVGHIHLTVFENHSMGICDRCCDALEQHTHTLRTWFHWKSQKKVGWQTCEFRCLRWHNNYTCIHGQSQSIEKSHEDCSVTKLKSPSPMQYASTQKRRFFSNSLCWPDSIFLLVSCFFPPLFILLSFTLLIVHSIYSFHYNFQRYARLLSFFVFVESSSFFWQCTAFIWHDNKREQYIMIALVIEWLYGSGKKWVFKATTNTAGTHHTVVVVVPFSIR